MSLVFAGIVPHPPTLIPELTQDTTEELQATKAAYAKLEQDLYLSKPDIVLVLSAYTGSFPEAFVINADPSFTANFEQFGDFSIKSTWQGATDLAALMLSHSRKAHVPIKLVNEPILDSGVSIPLHLLGSHIPHVKVLPIGFSHLDTDAHVTFGHLLRDECMNSNKRIAVLVSGHLSGATAPATDSSYDQLIRTALTACDCSAIQHMQQSNIDASNNSIHKNLLVLTGLLGEGNTTYSEYSYEAPHGVGYLVANIDVS